MAPAPIESLCKEDFLIEQIMVVGDKRKFVSALIVPAPEALENFCQENNIAWKGLDDAVQNPKVVAEYQRIIDGLNHCNKIHII